MLAGAYSISPPQIPGPRGSIFMSKFQVAGGGALFGEEPPYLFKKTIFVVKYHMARPLWCAWFVVSKPLSPPAMSQHVWLYHQLAPSPLFLHSCAFHLDQNFVLNSFVFCFAKAIGVHPTRNLGSVRMNSIDHKDKFSTGACSATVIVHFGLRCDRLE